MNKTLKIVGYCVASLLVAVILLSAGVKIGQHKQVKFSNNTNNAGDTKNASLSLLGSPVTVTIPSTWSVAEINEVSDDLPDDLYLGNAISYATAVIAPEKIGNPGDAAYNNIAFFAFQDVTKANKILLSNGFNLNSKTGDGWKKITMDGQTVYMFDASKTQSPDAECVKNSCNNRLYYIPNKPGSFPAIIISVSPDEDFKNQLDEVISSLRFTAN